MSLVAVGVTTATQSISLSNFTPRIENLPSSCQNAYTTSIEGCQVGDFMLNARCSASCVQGLVKVAKIVSQQCANVDVSETSIIGVFLLGQGIPALCPGIEVITVGTSSTQAPPPQTSTQAPASSTVEAQPSPSSAPATNSSPNEASTESSTLTSAAATTNTPSQSVAQNSTMAQPQLTLDTSSAPSAPAQTANSQKSNQDSGGGSPFDVQAVGSSLRLICSDCAMIAMLGVVSIVATML